MKDIKQKYWIIALFLCMNVLQAQTFMKVYPTTYDKTSRDIVYTGDGYIIAGMTNNSNILDCDAYIMKTDLGGNMIWQKTYGGNKPDYPYSMCATHDGNFFILGFTQSFGSGDYDVYLLKINSNGDKIWEKNFGGWGNEEGREIIKTSDNNYMIVGTSGSSNWTSGQNAFLMKIDVDGALIWRKYYGGSGLEFGNSVKQCSDGGYILTGQTFSYGQDGNTYVVRTNSAGDTVWTRHFGGTLSQEGVSIVSHSDGSSTFVVRDSTASSDIDVRIMKLDASGNVVFNKVYGGAQKDTPKTIYKTSDGGFIVGAISRSFGWINPDMWIMKMSASGDTSWTRHYGGSDHDHCHMAKEHVDGGLLAIGHSRSFSPGQKIMFLKLDGNGMVSVKEQFAFSSAKIFPNPSSDGKFTIATNANGTCKITINDITGRCVYTEESLAIKPDGELHIEIDKNPGLYFLTLQTGEKIVTGKFVIN